MHKRGKPQQEIYRPGSGPLRKSNNITEESDADNNSNLSSSNSSKTNNYSSVHHHHHHNETKYRDDDNSSIVSEHNVQRKTRKPEQKIYVPRAVANARDMPQTQPDQQPHQNGNYDNDRYRNNKRFTQRRHFHEEWRPQRQGSEPRGPHPSNQRTRDTRSVEPSHIPSNSNRNYDKGYTNKPPSGRRHSTIGLESDKRQNHKMINVDKLPPRFRRKMLEENKLNHPGGGGVDDNWNGASLTFQGTSNYVPPPNCYQMANHPQQNYNNSHQHHMGYNTLPNRHRGRGRFLPEYETVVRSKTPDLVGVSSPCNSRPPTPPHGRTRSNDNLYTSRPQSPANYNNRSNNDYRSRNQKERQPHPHSRRNNHYRNNYERNQEVQEENWDNLEDERHTVKPGWESPSPVSPQSPEEKPKLSQTVSVTGNNAILDWSEEVELSERLEAEALSDALTRSSSVTSLVDTSLKQNNKHRSSRRKNGRRSGSRNRDRSQDTFKIPGEPPKPRRNRRDSSYEKHASRENSRNRTCSTGEQENWREEIRSRQNSERENSDRSRKNSEQSEKINVKKAGVLVLPGANKQESVEHHQPRYPEVTRKPVQPQKSLFDHNNPSKPIIVKSPGSRVSVPGFSDNAETAPPQLQYTTDQYGNLRPGWYDETSDGYKSCHYPNLINDIQRADAELEFIMNSGSILINWGTVESLRQFLKDALQYLLCKDLKFCQKVNVEQHLWKTLYHNIIEVTRKAITSDLQNKEQYKVFLLFLIDEGTKYFEGLIESLEETYKFKLNNFLGNNLAHSKGLGYVGLALISVQKLLLFLGDLGRYREQVNETSNYGKCRQWYIKAHEINPKNGKPYNQLAVLAVYSRRKLDAVYYYMRSLMSSNPVNSARECLISLLDENRKKYEQGERKRREERLERAKQHMKQKESEDAENSPHHQPGSLRHETWIRPDGGRRVHRTTQALHHQDQKDSEEEDLAALTSVEVNKRFVISYLHVHGKLITKIGMESFQEAAMQMLKEFRALLQHSPVPLPCNRFLQLLALNMFAIESTQLKDPQLQQQAGYRSELQERALVVSLQMFNLILERTVQLLEEAYPSSAISPDVHVLLPAVKIWCDWMLCHSSIWNPPPSTQDFRIGSPDGDIWTRLATLMTLLYGMEPLTASANLIYEPAEGYEQIKLPEDSVLCGFTPLMVNEPDVVFCPLELDLEFAQLSLRITKLLFFGTVFLCGLEPPVLKLEIEDEEEKYVSVVSTSQSRDSPVVPERSSEEVLLERFSDEEDVADGEKSEKDEGVEVEGEEAPPKEVRDLISRKVELERTQRRQKLHNLTVQKILSQNVVSVHIEVRPKYLVPDTNCFIDHLDRIAGILAAHVYTLMVPIVVLSELEGLSRGGRTPAPSTRRSLTPQHVQKVAQASKKALAFLQSKPASVKCVTTKGAVLSSTTFTTEDDSMLDASFKNDDKILATSLALNKSHGREQEPQQEQNEKNEPRKLVSEVVLLTDDRNLRVKALARNVPVRELVDFMQWAGLG